jgi:hypothetical protein
MSRNKWYCIFLIVLLVVVTLFAYSWYSRHHFSPIEGHTELPSGQPSGDYYDHCFASNNNLEVVLTLSMPDIKQGKVEAFLMDLHKAGDFDPSTLSLPLEHLEPPNPNPPSDLKDGHAQVRFSDKERVTHLGPGPYMAAVTVTPTAATNLVGSKPRRFFYYYETYDPSQHQSPSSCAEYHKE